MKNIYGRQLGFRRDRRVDPFALRIAWNEKCSLGDDRETGRLRGFAFVEMAGGDADKAIAALNGKNVGGRALNVNEARPKADRAGSGAEGGGRGRGRRW